MKLSSQERAARRESFRAMGPAAKIEHIYTYYKVHILLVLAAAAVLCSVVHHRMTQKEAVLYTALVNVTVGSDLEARLNGDYLTASGLNGQKQEVFFYRDLYLSEDPAPENHEIAYASNLKMLAIINAQQLDLVLMNREAYDILSGSGYLMPLSDIAPAQIQPHLTANTVVLEDNAIEYNLNEADAYIAVTEEVVNAVALAAAPAFREAGFDDAVYLGIIGNTARIDTCLDYLDYLFASE